MKPRARATDLDLPCILPSQFSDHEVVYISEHADDADEDSLPSITRESPD